MMATQGKLFEQSVKTKTDKELYDRENPRIWDWFKKITFRLINNGHNHYSSDGVLHIIRWETSIVTKGSVINGRKFKINNNMSSYYSRKFENDFPQHKGFFLKRKTKNTE